MRASVVAMAALLVAAAALVVVLTRSGPEAPAGTSAPPPAEAPALSPAPPQTAPTEARDPDPGAAPAPEPPPAPLFDARGEPSREFVRASLERALAERLPRVKLSPRDVERLTDAAVALRTSRRELARIADDPEATAHRRALREQLLEATAAFTEILGMTPDAFTEAVEQGGVDTPDPLEAVPPGETIEAWRARQEAAP